MRWSMIVPLAVACHQPAPKVAAPMSTVDPAAGLLTAIETGDYTQALRVWCAGYAAAGLPCSSVVTVEHLQPTDVLSRVSDHHVIRMQPMPAKGQGIAYWENWSKVLGGDVHTRFRGNDDEARVIANTMLLTVFAHELGHHVAMRHGCRDAGAEGELLADELSTPLVQQHSHGAFGVIQARMRFTADAMIAAVPDAERMEVPRDVDVRAWARAHELPAKASTYASLHLSRQRRLLEETAQLTDVVKRTCGARSRRRMLTRIVEPGVVRTRGEWPIQTGDEIAIDRSGAVWAFAQDFDRMTSITVRRLDRAGPVRALTLPQEPLIIRLVAAESSSHFLLGDGKHAWEVTASADGTLVATPLELPPHDGLALDAHGVPWWSIESKTEWAAASAHDRVDLDLDLHVPGTFERDADAWRDGDRGSGQPRAFAIGERVVFGDAGRAAIRAIDRERVTTIAGSIEGRRDGTTDEAEFLDVTAVAALADGSYAVAERTVRSVILRIITKT